MLTMPFPFASVRLTSDAFGACLGAFGGEEGAILIAGTGSAGLIYRHGQLHTCSGRGFSISDLGGGAWLGCAPSSNPCSATTASCPQHAGHPLARSLQAGSGRGGALGRPRHSGRLRPLRPWVFDAASDGDELACQLLDETCQQLATLLEGCASWVPTDSPARRHRHAPHPRLAHLPLVSPGADALEGAILFARSEAYPCLHPPESAPIHPTPKCGPDPGLPAAGMPMSALRLPAGVDQYHKDAVWLFVPFTPSEEFSCLHP